MADKQKPAAWRYRFPGGEYWQLLNAPWPKEWSNGVYECQPLYLDPPMSLDAEVEREALVFILNEARAANNVIAHKRHDTPQGRTKMATTLHRIEQKCRAALATADREGAV